MTEVLGSADFLLSSAAERHAGYAQLRGLSPVLPITLKSGETGFLVTGFEAARLALTDQRLQGRTATVGNRRNMPGHLHKGMNSHMLNVGPPDHTRLRRLVSAAFTRRRMLQMRPRIQAITDGLLDTLGQADEADFIGGLALPLPIRVLIEMFGIPGEDAGQFHSWTEIITSSTLTRDELGEAGAEMLAYIQGLLARKRREPQPDLLSALVAVHDGEDRLSRDELTSMVFLLLTAGHETTVNLIGNTMLSLLTHPGQLAAVRADPGLLPASIEEGLRFESPVQVALRFSLEPLELAGVQIPPGATVLVALLAANRDPRRFPGPDTLEVTRTDNPQLAFGYGIHHCIGAPLARLEGVVAIGSTLSRFPGLRLAGDAASLGWRPSVIMHGLTALPVRLRSVPASPPSPAEPVPPAARGRP